jgi:hypothetical protein
MQPSNFPYSNITFAKDQPGYMPLPAWTDGAQVISRWTLNWRERLHVLLTGVVWVRMMTFGKPLQPLRPQVLDPFPKLPTLPNDNE